MSESSLQVSGESGGLELSFLSAPPEDLVCSICLSVHRQPVLTSCCGNHFCFICVELVRQEGRACPLCGAEKFTTMLDKYFVRKVNELQVECKNKEHGCTWQGSVNDLLHRHLDQDKGDCKYMQISCPHKCGLLLMHSEFEKHKKSCPRRPYDCKFCGFTGVFEEMGTKHWKVCEKYPLPCPNGCGEVDIERCLMEKHLDSGCSQHKRKCEFAYAGCKKVLASSRMEEHLASNMQYHLSLLSKHCLNLTESFSSEFRTKMEKELHTSDSKLASLEAKLKHTENEVSRLKNHLSTVEDEMDALKTENVHLRSVVFVPPFECIMTRFREHKQTERQWLSPAFYTNFAGYRMCISVDASGSEEGGGTHMSVYANVMKGEYDDHLKWPFKGSITIQLCNQRDPSKGHFEETIVFTYDDSAIASRVTGGEIAEHGLGIPTFIEHSKLLQHTERNVEIQYLKNDCLRFKVLEVDLMNRRSTMIK